MFISKRAGATGLIALLTAMAIGTPSDAGDYFVSGNDLHKTCKADFSACIYFVAGVIDASSTLEEDMCLSKDAKLGQLHEIVMNYMQENAQDRHYAANSIVRVALREAFCEK